MLNSIREIPAAKRSPDDARFEARMEIVMTSVDLHHVYLREYLFGLTKHWQDAEDLAQELWKYVVLHFPHEKITHLPLLRLKAKQLFLDHYRAARRRSEILTDEVPEEIASEHQEPFFSHDSESALQEKFWANFEGIDLSDRQRNAIWRHARYGWSYEEVGRQMGVPTSTIGDWITLGRKRISEFLK